MAKLNSIQKRFTRWYWWYWVSGIIMVLSYTLLSPFICNDVNPDLVAYLSVADHYQNLDFIQAFNSYWSPLLCWLLALSPVLKSYPIETYRVVNIIVAFIIFYQLFFWIRLIVKKSFTRLLMCLLLTILLVELSLSAGAADFLSVSCFLLFMDILIHYRPTKNKTIQIACAVLLCYFSKAFLLFLCIGIIFLYSSYLFLFLKKKISFRLVVLFFIVLSSTLAIWAVCLRLHYGYYTLSDSAKFNNTAGAEDTLSLMPPPFEKSLFMWEDPAFIKTKEIYTGTRADIQKVVISKVQYNFRITVYYFKFISYLHVFILIFPLAGFFMNRNLQWKSSMLLFSVFIMNWFGYFLVFIMERYLWIGQICLYIAVFGFAEIMITKFYLGRKKWFETGFFTLLFFLIIKNPVAELRYNLKVYDGPHNEILQARKLASMGILNGKKIATFDDCGFIVDYLTLSCFQGGGKYYGEVYTKKTFDKQQSEILKYKLDYIAVYDKTISPIERKNWLSTFQLAYKDSVMNVKIYNLHKKIK